MSRKQQTLKLPKCIICKDGFDTSVKLPTIQSCLHPICTACLQKENVLECPKDQAKLDLNGHLNYPLVHLLQLSYPEPGVETPESLGDDIESGLCMVSNLLHLNEKQQYLSPQLERKLLHLLIGSYKDANNRLDFINRCRNVVDRLILELIQAHYSTKQRINDFLKAVQNKGCSIENPLLNEFVIDQILKLYEPTNFETQFTYERRNIVNFVEFSRNYPESRVVEKSVPRIVQTLYKAECFDVINRVEGPSRLKLRANLVAYDDIRTQHDLGLMGIAHEYRIRLNPETWSSILYNSTNPDDISRMQSLLDRHQPPVDLAELREAICHQNDKYKILELIIFLEDSIRIMERATASQDIQTDNILELVSSLNKIQPLFKIRRGKAIL